MSYDELQRLSKSCKSNISNIILKNGGVDRDILKQVITKILNNKIGKQVYRRKTRLNLNVEIGVIKQSWTSLKMKLIISLKETPENICEDQNLIDEITSKLTAEFSDLEINGLNLTIGSVIARFTFSRRDKRPITSQERADIKRHLKTISDGVNSSLWSFLGGNIVVTKIECINEDNPEEQLYSFDCTAKLAENEFDNLLEIALEQMDIESHENMEANNVCSSTTYKTNVTSTCKGDDSQKSGPKVDFKRLVMEEKLKDLKKLEYVEKAELFIEEYFRTQAATNYIRNVIAFIPNKKYIIGIGTVYCTKVYLKYHFIQGWIAIKRMEYNDNTKPSMEKIKNVIESICNEESHHSLMFFTMLDMNPDDEYCYIISELCEHTLKVQLEHDVTMDNRIKYVKDLLDGLNYLHCEKNIVHRDLKPSNILFNKRGGLKISDFGFARQDINSGDSRVANSPEWSAPRLLLEFNATVTKQDDVYSAALLVYFIMCGKHPFKENENELLNDAKVYINRLKNLQFCCEMKDEKMQKFFYNTFKKLNELQLNSKYTTSDLLDDFTNAVKAMGQDKSTPGYRYAILLSFSSEEETRKKVDEIDVSMGCGDNNSVQKKTSDLLHIRDGASLKSSKTDVRFLWDSLQSCGFNYGCNDMEIKVIDDISPADLEKLFQLVAEKINTIIADSSKNENFYLWFHASAHGFYQNGTTIIRCEGGKWVSIKDMISCFYAFIPEQKSRVKSIFTIDACRGHSSNRKVVELKPQCDLQKDEEYFVLYSCEPGVKANDTGVPHIPSPFSRALAEYIKTNTNLEDALENAVSLAQKNGSTQPHLEGTIFKFVL